jgi:hypothetical protein
VTCHAGGILHPYKQDIAISDPDVENTIMYFASLAHNQSIAAASPALFQSAFTNWCPMMFCLSTLGVRR